MKPPSKAGRPPLFKDPVQVSLVFEAADLRAIMRWGKAQGLVGLSAAVRGSALLGSGLAVEGNLAARSAPGGGR